MRVVLYSEVGVSLDRQGVLLNQWECVQNHYLFRSQQVTAGSWTTLNNEK